MPSRGFGGATPLRFARKPVVVIDLARTRSPANHEYTRRSWHRCSAELNRGFTATVAKQGEHRGSENFADDFSKVDTGTNPDAILFEPGQKEVYAFNGRGQSATVIDAKSGKK